MQLSTLQINGFRCFSTYHFRLSPRANVLIGRNGSGKTTLIHALIKALSFVFSNDRSLGHDFLSAGNNTLNVRGFVTEDFHLDPSSRQFVPEVNLQATGRYHNISLDWSLFKRNLPKAGLNPSRYKEAFTRFMSLAQTAGTAWPLLAYYSDSYPHIYSRITTTTLNLITRDIVPRNFGYYQWDNESACTSLWEARLCNRLAKAQPLHSQLAKTMGQLEAYADQQAEPSTADTLQSFTNERIRIESLLHPLQSEIEAIASKLSQFLTHLPQIQTDGYDFDYFTPIQATDGYRLVLNFKDGRSIPLQNLPAGYRRLLSIVIDLAYRAYLLNPGEEAEGIAIIDEIDLHLHPALEQSVLPAFLATFPRLQFVVSTHSVAVISNLDTAPHGEDASPSSQILVMSSDSTEPQILPNLWGMDYNAVLRDFLGAPSRNDDLRRLEDKYLTYLSLQLSEEAASVYQQIVTLVGENAEVLHTIREKADKYLR